jgi:hypothetical protein
MDIPKPPVVIVTENQADHLSHAFEWHDEDYPQPVQIHYLVSGYEIVRKLQLPPYTVWFNSGLPGFES